MLAAEFFVVSPLFRGVHLILHTLFHLNGRDATTSTSAQDFSWIFYVYLDTIGKSGKRAGHHTVRHGMWQTSFWVSDSKYHYRTNEKAV